MADIPPPPPPPPSNALPPPPTAPPPYQGTPPQGFQAPMMPPQSPGYMPNPIGPAAGAGLGLGAQLYAARSSIIVGVIGILVPVLSAVFFGGTVVYFYVLPAFGIYYGIRVLTRGVVIGGLIGIALNVLAGLASLTAAGLINPG